MSDRGGRKTAFRDKVALRNEQNGNGRGTDAPRADFTSTPSFYLQFRIRFLCWKLINIKNDDL